MEKKPVRRVVTGHDEQGKAVVLIDGPTPYVNQRGEGNVVQLLWMTNESPADLSHTRDQAAQKTGVPPPPNGAILRVVDFAPYDGTVPKGIDHHEILKQMGIDPATQGYHRVNNSGKPCRICFVLIDSQDPPAWKKDWKPK